MMNVDVGAPTSTIDIRVFSDRHSLTSTIDIRHSTIKKSTILSPILSIDFQRVKISYIGGHIGMTSHRAHRVICSYFYDLSQGKSLLCVLCEDAPM